jgi:hypothetical protein
MHTRSGANSKERLARVDGVARRGLVPRRRPTGGAGAELNSGPCARRPSRTPPGIRPRLRQVNLSAPTDDMPARAFIAFNVLEGGS